MLRQISLVLLFTLPLYGRVSLGVDRLFKEERFQQTLHGKRVGLITNHTGQSSELISTLDLFLKHEGSYKLKAVFAPEHGLNGSVPAEKLVKGEVLAGGIPLYSLYGETRRPTKAMLAGIDLLVFDIQDVGARTYTYAGTLFYAMEEAAKANIPVLVLDRPNPIGGSVVDGPVVEEGNRSFVGYLNTPLCHGMTMGELARYFNGEYKVGCSLEVVPMKGWKRSMTFADCSLPWVPLSPQIPDSETPLYFPITGLIGEALSNVSIGIGYTLPFKVVGAPWLEAEILAKALNSQGLSGITFQPFEFSPFFGRFKGEVCRGVRLVVTDPQSYRPVSTGFMVLGVLKTLYPNSFAKGLKREGLGKKMLAQMSGTDEVFRILATERYAAWPLIGLHKEEREAFLKRRASYLLYK